MNLNSVVSHAVSAVNERTQLMLARSNGYATNASGKRVPTYDPPRIAWGQIQALTYQDIVHLDGMNIQGTRRAIYLEGDWEGLVRSEQKGGDLITFPNGTVWLVAVVLERWRHWTKVAVTQQNVPAS